MQFSAYIINLRSAEKRWETLCRNIEPLGIPHTRIEAIDGSTHVPTRAEYNRLRYNITHGKTTNPRELGCYLSHFKALRAFLNSTDRYGLILEDDIALPDNITQLLQAAQQHADCWDLLRLSAHKPGHPLPIADLPGGHVLAYNTRVLKNTGAYLVNRHATQCICDKMLPMFLPYDVALDCEWNYKFKTAYIHPLPVLINYDLPSQINPARKIRFFRATTFHLFHGIRHIRRKLHRTRCFRNIRSC